MKNLSMVLLSAIGLMAFAQNGSRSGTPDSTPPVSFRAVSEGFDDILTLPGSGWLESNQSTTIGTTNYFQGNDGVFSAHAGATTAYIGVNFNSTTGSNTISNWLVTPQINFGNGDSISFFTRTATGSSFPDRLQVRASLASTDTGTSATDVGDFTNLLTDINPTLAVGGYPETWTEFPLNSGLTGAGYVAFRYFVTDGGPSGTNSNYIGIDSVTIGDGVSIPTMSEWGMIAFVGLLLAISVVYMRRQKQA